MKSLLIIATLMISTVSMASPRALVILAMSSGAMGYERTITVNDDGSVQEMLGPKIANGGPSLLSLATLSTSELAGLEEQIAAVQIDQSAVDPNPNGPSCASMGFSSVSILKADGHVLTISSTGGCHTISVPGSNALVKTMQSISLPAK